MTTTATHPAFSVGNIHTHVKTTLSIQDGDYRTWRHIFIVHCGSYGVQDHLTRKPTETDKADELWQRLDYLILSWIYSTILADILTMVIDPDATAYDTWIAIENLFRDNKKSRALALMEEYNSCTKGTLSITEYCNKLKKLVDQLKDVDHNISNEELVLKCLRGLPSEYQSLYNIIPLQTPFPDFLQVRSMLLLEEDRQASRDNVPTTHNSTTALFASPSMPPSQNQSPNNTTGSNKGGKGKPNWKNNNKWGHKGTKHNFNGPKTSTYGFNTPWGQYSPYPWGQYTPYPFAYNQPSWMPPYYSAGILGPRPSAPCTSGAQAFVTATPSSTPQCPPGPPASWPTHAMEPTALAHYFDTMSLQPPSDNNWYMDSGATSHMTHSTGPADREGDSPL